MKREEWEKREKGGEKGLRMFFHFLQYHNAIPIALGILVLGAGGVFAATNPEAIYSETRTPLSIDNTYLVGKDLSSYSPKAEIVEVTEDENFYYVAYKLSTIDLKDYSWQDIVRDEVMKVSKLDLGPYRDLGVYVTEQLKQIIGSERARLAQTQEAERKSVSQKVVSIAYGGLIGKFLDAKTEVLPGYTPVVEAPPPPPAAAGPADQNESGTSAPPPTTVFSGGSSNRIRLQLLGNNPARISLGTTYIDLGAVLIDPYNTNVGVYVFLDGKETLSPTIDTSTTTSHAIEYRATDPANGSTIMVRRIVLVGSAPDPGGEISTAGNVDATPVPAASTPSPEPAPAATSSPNIEVSATSSPETIPAPEPASTTPAATSVAESNSPAEGTSVVPVPSETATSTSSTEATSTPPVE